MTNLAYTVSQLSDNQTLTIRPQGYSMCPFFCGGRDSVEVIAPVFPLKRGDIAVFLRKDGTYVIHRICRVADTDDGEAYYFVGDNQTAVEGPVIPSQIHAVVVSFTRKNRRISCSNRFYRILAGAWLALRPVRPFLTFLENSLRNLKNRSSKR